MEHILSEEKPFEYYANVKEFVNGGVEILLKVVKPMLMETLKERYESFGAVSGHRRDDLSESEKEAKAKDNWNRSVRRAKQNIRWLCKQMEADRLFTLTYRENIQDRERVKADFKIFLRRVRYGGFKYYDRMGRLVTWRGAKDWKYVAVLEKQERGALHIHCAVKGFQNVQALRAAWYLTLGADADAKGSETPGAVNVTSPRSEDGVKRRQWKTNRLAGYITKYLEKTFDESASEKKRYWHAKDISRPVKSRLWICASNMLQAMDQVWHYAENVYGANGGYFHWINDDNTTYWLTCDCDPDSCQGAPF